MKHKILFFIICCFLSNIFVYAQSENGMPASKDSSVIKKVKPRFFSVGFAAASYRGDLSNRYRRYMPMIQLGLQFEKKKRLNGLVSLFFGTIGADNPLYSVINTPDAKPNLSFTTRIISFQYELQLNLISRPMFRIFVSQGFGIMNFSPQDENKQSLFEQQQSRPASETYGAMTASLPTGLGVRAKLPNNIRFMISAHWQNIQTDYLDNIGLWGNKKGSDNIFLGRFLCQIPI